MSERAFQRFLDRVPVGFASVGNARTGGKPTEHRLVILIFFVSLPLSRPFRVVCEVFLVSFFSPSPC